MKKTFLSLVFAITMGVSLFAGTMKNASADPIISGNTISMTTLEDYTFKDATSIEFVSGEPISINGTTVSALSIGESVVRVTNGESQKTDYKIVYSLPIGFYKTDCISFNQGNPILDTDYYSTSDSLHISFNYTGSLTYRSFGYQDGTYNTNYIAPCDGGMWIGNRTYVIIDDLHNQKDNKTLFDMNISNNTVDINFAGNNYSEMLKGTTVTNYDSNIWFGTQNTSTMKYVDQTYFHGNLFDLKIEQNNILKRNYFPCLDINESRFGMYDVVNNKMTYSNNEYNFTAPSSQLDTSKYYYSNGNIKNEVINGKILIPKNENFASLNNKLFIESGASLIGSNGVIVDGKDAMDLTKVFGIIDTFKTYVGFIFKDNTFVSTLTFCFGDYAEYHINSSVSLKELNSSKDTIASGTLTIDEGASATDLAFSKMKLRGNTYGLNLKNSYNLTLETKFELISGANAQRHYCLLGFPRDGHSFLESQIAFSLYKELDKNNNAICYRIINLYYNDVDLGMYMVTEKVRIDPEVIDITKTKSDEVDLEKRTVNSSNYIGLEKNLLDIGIKEFKYCPNKTVKSEGGYIIEAGFYYTNAPSGFITSHNNYWEVKEPECLSLEQITKIATYVQKAEDALFSETGFNSDNKYFTEYYDLDSIARDFLVRSFTLEADLYVTSNYLYVDGDSNGPKGLLKAGPVWDFDYSFTFSKDYENKLYSPRFDKYESTNPQSRKFLRQLLQKGEFFDNVKNINDDEFSNIIQTLIDTSDICSYSLTYLNNTYSPLRDKDDTIWNLNASEAANETDIFCRDRVKKWQSMWSNNEYLKKVSISASGNVLSCDNEGATSYQWYKLNESDGTLTAIEGATEKSLVINSQGKYYVSATGKALGENGPTSMISEPYNTFSREVVFDNQGHGNLIPSQSIILGEPVKMPNTPYETGYVFKGWYKEAQCINRWNFANDIVNDDTTLYAKWVEGGTLFTTTSISLCDNTWLNMYTELIDDDHLQYNFKYTLRNAATEYVLDASMLMKIGNRWRISIPLLPYQLADIVTVNMYDNDGHLICTKADSVRAYGKRLLDNSTDQNEKDAMLALLNYGAAVQKLKGYHTDDLANDFSKLPQA